MKIENDNYLKHFIKEYKKSIEGESEDIQANLTAVLEHALNISSRREEFFELLSYGNFRLTTHQGEVNLDVVKEEMSLEKTRIRAYRKTNELFDQPPVVKDTNPYTIVAKEEAYDLIRKEVEQLPEEEKKVITELFFNDTYVNALVTEMKKSADYIMTLKKSAIANMYMKISEFYKEEPKKEDTPVKKR